jgi:hypothetical protein
MAYIYRRQYQGEFQAQWGHMSLATLVKLTPHGPAHAFLLTRRSAAVADLPP